MNEIYLIRGKAINRYPNRTYRTDYENGDWVYGLITDTENYQGFAEMTNTDGISGIDVDKNTIGRCTGLRDKNGKLIFKDDVLKGFSYPFLSDEEHNYYAIVVWFEDSAAFGIYTIKNPESKVRGISSGNTEYMSEWDSNNWEIIGNIHDNPELLEVEK